MTEEAFESLAIPEELLALIQSYETNKQLFESAQTQQDEISDEEPIDIPTIESESDDDIFDLSLLFWDATEESLYLDILFTESIEAPCQALTLFVEISATFEPRPSVAKLIKSCSIEALNTEDHLSSESVPPRASVKDLVQLFEGL